MSQRFDDTQLLTHYFLGIASAAERKMVEDMFFVDPTLEKLLRAEDELIDDYVRGALTTTERALFEGNFLCTAERRHRLKFTSDLAEALASTEAERLFAAPDQAPSRPQAIESQLEARPKDATSRQAENSWGQLARDYQAGVFSSLLEWLDPIHDRAVEKYETIRKGLIKMFAVRGYVEAEDLADVTIDRVALKVPELRETYSGDPASYFHAVARSVLLEGLRRPMLSKAALLNIQVYNVDDVEQTHKCLEKCLEQLSERNRELILRYYSSGKERKIDSRIDLAQSLGISLSALRTRTHRIRTSIHNCISSCLEQTKRDTINKTR